MALSNDIDMDKQGEKMLRDAFQNTVEAMETARGRFTKYTKIPKVMWKLPL